MPWVIIGYKRDPDGNRIPIRKWVAEKKKKKATQKNTRRDAAQARIAAEGRRRAREAAQRRARERARRRAAERAAEIARKRAAAAAAALKAAREAQRIQVENARRQAYEELSRRQSELLRRANLVRERRESPPAAPARKPGGTAVDMNVAERRAQVRMKSDVAKRQAAAMSAQKAARLQEAERQRWVEYGRQQKLRNVMTNPDAPITHIEELIAEEVARAKRGQINAKTVSDLSERYWKHAEKVGKDYNRAADKLQAQIDRVNAFLKAGNVTSARSAYRRYLKLFKENSKTFREYDRLFGSSGGAVGSGAFNKFTENYNAIDRASTEWWKSQTKSALDRQGDEVNRLLKDAISRGDAGAIRELQDLSRVYQGKTSTVFDPTTHSYRKRTIEEELDYRAAQRRIEMEKIRAQYQAQVRRAQKEMRMEGLVPGLGGALVKPEVAEVERYLMKVTGGEAPKIKRAQDLQGLAGQVIKTWHDEQWKARGFAGKNLSRYADPKDREAYGKFLRDKAAFEKQVYAYYDSRPPEWWDRVFAAPGVSHGLAFLQGIPSVLSLGARAGKGALTGSTQFDFGVTMADAPPEVKRELDKLPPAGPANSQRQQYWLRWLNSPEGRSWRENRDQEYRTRVSEQDAAFHKALGGDPGDVLDAINAYGAEPTSRSDINLMIQLLADPTNAVPLKFTTYLARAKYAADLAGKAESPLTKGRMALRGFAVDESVLRRQKFFEEIAAKTGGDKLKIQEQIDRLGLELAGITEKSALDKAARAGLEKIGLDRRDVDVILQENLVEDLITRKISRRHIEYQSKADEAKAQIEQAEKAKAAEKTRRASVGRKREATLKAGQELREREAVAARKRVGAAHTTAVTELRKQVEELGARPKPIEAKPKPVEAKPKPLAATPGPVSPVRRAVTDKIAKKVETKAKTTDVRPTVPYAPVDEYYRRVDEELLPQSSSLRHDEQWQWLKGRAEKGDEEARRGMAYLADLERNSFRAVGEDLKLLPKKGEQRSFSQTDVDFAERAGLELDDHAARARLEADRATVEELKNRAIKDAGKSDEFIRAHVRQRSDAPISRLDPEYVDDTDFGAVSRIGEDLLAARGTTKKDVRFGYGERLPEAYNKAESPAGLVHAYEPFSGLHADDYHGGIFDQVKDPAWRKRVGPKRFAKLIADLDADAMGTGIFGFRNGGQALFELFHGLRLSKSFTKLRELSEQADLLIDADEASLFAWMWKVMEHRAGLPWALDGPTVNAGFLAAARGRDLHEHLALSMVPNGYFGHPAPHRFGLAPELSRLADAGPGVYRVAPAGWNESKALQAMNSVFGFKSPAKDDGFNATRVLDWMARRYGGLTEGAFKAKNRLYGHVGFAAIEHMGVEEVAGVLLRYADEGAVERLAAGRKMTPQQWMEEELAPAVREARDPKKYFAPDFKKANQRMWDAYWAGEITHPHAEGHVLAWLARLQTDGRAWERINMAFFDHMDGIGQGERARRLIAEVFADARQRWTLREVTGIAVGGVDEGRQTLETQMWRHIGMRADVERAKAYVDSLGEGRAEQFAVDRAEAARLRQLGQFDNAQDFENAAAERASRDALSPAFAGRYDVDALRRNLNPDTLSRAIDSAVSGRLDGEAFEELRELMGDLRKGGAGDRLLDELRDRLGDDVLARWLNVADEFPEYRAQLQPKPVTAAELRAAERAKVAEAAAIAKTEREAGEAAYKGKPSENPPHDEVVDGPPPLSVAEQAALARAEQTLRIISGMSEEQWWDYLAGRARSIQVSKAASKAAKDKARQAINDIRKARFAREKARKGRMYIDWTERNRHANRVVALEGKNVEDAIAPNNIAPYVEDAQGLAVEQTRTYWRLLKSAAPDAVPSRVRGVHHEGTLVDHLPLEIYRKADAYVSEEIEKVRGYKANTRTRKRRAPGPLEQTRGRRAMTDRDLAIVQAKLRGLRRLADETGWSVPISAYDEGRYVYWRGHVQGRSAEYLMNTAQEIVRRWGGDYTEIYKNLRLKEAKAEARRQLHGMAFGEYYGHTPDEIAAEFLARWGDDGTLRGFTPELTSFQRRSLEEAVKDLAGLDELDEVRMGFWLRSRNAPSWGSRAASREFLTHIGAWSPRTSETITLGNRSWSVDAEAKYWRTNYGHVPEWADRQVLGERRAIFHDLEAYFEQMRSWGIFNRSMDWRMRLTGQSVDDIEDMILSQGKRDHELQRRYVIERYGDLVSKDGVHLDAMPWLMTEAELRRYIRHRTLDGAGLADTIFQSEAELTRFLDQSDEIVDDLFEKYIGEKAAAGPIQYEDVYRFASEVLARILADPTWSKRYRDLFGDGLNAWATGTRALVFTQLSFLVMNVIDVPIKTGWMRYANRELFKELLAGDVDDVFRAAGLSVEDIAERARALTPQDLGIDVLTTLYRYAERSLKDVATKPLKKGLAGKLEQLSAVPRGLYRFAPHYAGKVEIMGKMNLARGMYPQVFADALRRLGDPELAEVAARRFIKKEIMRMWPTAGDGTLEGLFNQIVPFASYMVKNRILFISEALGHPSILNKIEFIGAAIERENRANWERENPGIPMPNQVARRIELPWAPGYYLDLGQFSDATRGLKPIYKAASGEQSYIDFVSQWVRVVNPSSEAGLLMLTNALGVTQRVQFRPIRNADGFITGYEKVLTGWTEPWSDEEPTPSSVFHFLEAWDTFQEFLPGGMTAGEWSQLIGKVTLFDAISTPDRGAALFELYKVLREKDADKAKAWLTGTTDGQLLEAWLLSHQDNLVDVADWFTLNARKDADPRRWFHSQTPEFQKAVRDGYDRIAMIERAFETKMLDAKTPEEEKELKAQLLLAVGAVYRETPELWIKEVYSMSAADWSRQLQRWQTNMKMDEFFALDKLRPDRANFKSAKAYNDAVDAWEHQKELFLKTHPDVEDALGRGRRELQRVRDQVQKEWDAIFDRIGKRNEAIEAAKAKDQDLLVDMLHLQNEFDYGRLRQDHVSLDWDESDWATLPRGALGPPKLREGALKRATEILDLDRRSYAKAVREGRGQEWLDNRFYGQGMKEVVLKAKGGDPFGKFDPAKFVAELRKRPKLLDMYFDKNPGKRQEWARTAEYVRLISRWGKAIGANNWDLAERVWSQLPDWVKRRYIGTHPDTKMTLSGPGGGGGGFQYKGQFFKSAESRARFIEGSQYMGWMQRWTGYFERDDVKGGMKFFWSMPRWVRERYFAKHPEKRAKWEAQMRYGAQLAEYFGMDEAGQAEYLKSHPELKKWLAQNASSKEARRQSILAAYRALPKGDAWLKRVFRERYPEVFSQEAAGERRLRRVYDRLAAHPEMLPAFEEWVKAIWASYTEMLKHVGARPRPLEVERLPRRRSRSAAETSRAA